MKEVVNLETIILVREVKEVKDLEEEETLETKVLGAIKDLEGIKVSVVIKGLGEIKDLEETKVDLVETKVLEVIKVVLETKFQ